MKKRSVFLLSATLLLSLGSCSQSKKAEDVVEKCRSSGNGYTGSFNMRIADDDAIRFGMLFGDVSATTNGNELKVILLSTTITRGVDGSFFSQDTEYYPRFVYGSPILKIKKSGSTYRLIPLGNMKNYLTDILELTIVKTQ